MVYASFLHTLNIWEGIGGLQEDGGSPQVILGGMSRMSLRQRDPLRQKHIFLTQKKCRKIKNNKNYQKFNCLAPLVIK